MLAKPKRLNLKTDFKFVASGKKLDSPLVTMFIKVGDQPTPRVGIALNSKIFKKAYERNRVRRVVSAAFESLYSRLPESINIVALPKGRVLGVKSGDLLLEIEAALRSEKILED